MRKILTSVAGRALAPALLLALAACSGGGPGAEGTGARPAAAETRVEIVGFADLDAALAARRGSGLLLNLWATWCAPCVAELPELVAVGERYRDRGGRVVGLSYDLMVAGADPATIEADLRAFLAQRGLALDVLVYDEADYDAINERWGLPGEIPVTLAIDASGRVVDRQEGRAGAERFEEMMRAALGL